MERSGAGQSITVGVTQVWVLQIRAMPNRATLDKLVEAYRGWMRR